MSADFTRAALALQGAGRVHGTAPQAPGKAGGAEFCCTSVHRRAATTDLR